MPGGGKFFTNMSQPAFWPTKWLLILQDLCFVYKPFILLTLPPDL